MIELARSLLEQCQENELHQNYGSSKGGIGDKNVSRNNQRMTSVQLYQLGLILYDTRQKLLDSSSSSSSSLEEAYDMTCHAYRDLMETITCQNLLWYKIYPAFLSLLLTKQQQQQQQQQLHHDKKNEGDNNDICLAIQSLCGLLRHLSPNNNLFFKFSAMDDNEQQKSPAATDDHTTKVKDKPIQKQLLESCASIYYNDYNKTSNLDGGGKDALLELLSIWILHGILHTNATTNTAKKGGATTNATLLMETFHILSDNDDENLLSDLQQYQQNCTDYSNKSKSKNGSLLPIVPFQQAFTSLLSQNNNVHDESQEQLLNYLLLICKSSSTAKDTSSSNDNNNKTNEKNNNNNGSNNNRKKKNNMSSEETARLTLDRMVDQVRAILPHLGEGYIEAALKCYRYDVDRTVSMLLDDVNNLHPRLRALDPSLAASTQHSLRPQLKQQKEDMEAKKKQKQLLQQMEKDAEKQALMLEQFMTIDKSNTSGGGGGGEDEYNDDYDDQYDEIGNGNTNGLFDQAGLYDVDFDMLKEYNRTVKNIQQESEFWNAERNTNRTMKKNNQRKKNNDQNSDDEEDQANSDQNLSEKQYRGADKGKGGRIIGPDGKYLPFPKRGGRKQGPNKNNNNDTNESKTSTNNQKNSKKNKKGDKNQVKETGKAGNNQAAQKSTKNSNSNDDMTKQQKRRKNDNKAKIANHNRKGRALKKTGGMM